MKTATIDNITKKEHIMPRLPKILTDELEGTGLPWRIEQGSRHYKILLNDRLVAIYPRGKAKRDQGCGHRNLAAQIRRAVRLNTIHRLCFFPV